MLIKKPASHSKTQYSFCCCHQKHHQIWKSAIDHNIPVVDYNKLNDTQKEAFDKVEIGKGVIPQDELLSKRLPEMPSALVSIIEEIWAEEVVGK